MQNEMRDRLIELLLQSDPIKERDMDDEWVDGEIEDIVDHLIENGVLLPPCYIGQPVWEVYNWFTGKVEVREGKVSMLQQKADKTWKIRVSINSSVYDITVDDIGKRIFFSKEEVEKRQEELKNG